MPQENYDSIFDPSSAESMSEGERSELTERLLVVPREEFETDPETQVPYVIIDRIRYNLPRE